MQFHLRLLPTLSAVAPVKAVRLSSLFAAIVLTTAGLLFASSLSAQIEDPERVFRELRALEGTWFMPTDRGDRLESWRVQDDSTLIGRGFRIKPENGDTVTLENIRLELHDTTITYIVIARGQNQNKPVSFRLTVADYDGYVFENPAHDDPQKIRYLLLGNRELQVFTEGKRNNRPVTQEYVFEREFTPGAVEFRLRAGLNASSLRGSGTLIPLIGATEPEFGWKPGWEVSAQSVFKGRGGFVAINCELGLAGRYSTAKSEFEVFTDSSVVYKRDGSYSTIWLTLAVAPVYRSDGSGTNFLFTNYLSKVSEEFKSSIGANTSVQWPAGIGAKGNEGVANMTRQTQGAIGYVEYAYVKQNKMTYAKLINSTGKAVEPSSASFQAAAAGADWANSDNFHVLLTDQPGEASWPITGASFILIPTEPKDATTTKAALDFFRWAYEHGGDMASQLDYVPMPKDVVGLVEKAWSSSIKL